MSSGERYVQRQEQTVIESLKIDPKLSCFLDDIRTLMEIYYL